MTTAAALDRLSHRAALHWPRYAVAVLAVAASLALRAALQPWLGPSVPYLQFFPAILMASWFGGFAAGGLATVLSCLSAVYFFLPAVPGWAAVGVA